MIDKISVVILMYNDCKMINNCVNSVLTDARNAKINIEVLVVSNISTEDTLEILSDSLISAPEVTILNFDKNEGFAGGLNFGLNYASGEFVLFLENNIMVYAGMILGLLDELTSHEMIFGVQPLLLNPNGTIKTAGTVFIAEDSLPIYYLSGHPAEALPDLSNEIFFAVSSAAFLMRTERVRELGGFSTLYSNAYAITDLCLRAVEKSGDYFKIRPDAICYHLESQALSGTNSLYDDAETFKKSWHGKLPEPQTDLYKKAGFSINATTGTYGADSVPLVSVLVRTASDKRPQWGIRFDAPNAPEGDHHGEIPFAKSLGNALNRVGQKAVTWRFNACCVPTAVYDDISIVIRGGHSIPKMPGKINILWIICRPKTIGLDVIRDFDLVFCASESLARTLTEKSGREVVPLLQATDSKLFNIEQKIIKSDLPLFVASRQRPNDGLNFVRPTIKAAIATNTEIAVVGRNWRNDFPKKWLVADFIDNAQLASHYHGAPLVLADHKPDMAESGMIQNRLFDAVACGARTITDAVNGVDLDTMFSGAVRTWRTYDEFAYFCSTRGIENEFPNDQEMADIARKVQCEHSFDQRAKTMIDYTKNFILMNKERFSLNHRLLDLAMSND